jgi:hypothetical protein
VVEDIPDLVEEDDIESNDTSANNTAKDYI